jgi:hypothetical protein
MRRAIVGAFVLLLASAILGASGASAMHRSAAGTSRTAAGPHYTGWSEPMNLGPLINTPLTEQGGLTSKNGLSLYFIRRPQQNVGLGGDDIWVAQRESEEDEWGAPVKLGPTINTAFRETIPSLSRDGHWLFFVSDRPGGFGGAPVGDIWASWRPQVHDDFGWQTPINIGPNVNTASNDYGQTYFANDGGTAQLYFASDRPGGAGFADIYVSELQADGSWGPATRIPELSSAQAESGADIRHDGLEIVFHRQPAGSHSDLWVATRDSVDAPWSTPVNLGPPVNTAGASCAAPACEFDPRLAADGQMLFFDSNRPGGFGQYDLYMTTRSKSHGH